MRARFVCIAALLPPKRAGFCDAVEMEADRVEVSWDAGKHKWLVRIEIGAEVIRRHCEFPRDADEQTLRAAAAQTVSDEGYGVNQTSIVVIQ